MKRGNKRGKKKQWSCEIEDNKMSVVGPFTSIITLHGLNFPLKRHMVPGWMKKTDPMVWVMQETHSALRTHIVSKWRDGKIYSRRREKQKLKENWGSYS